MKHPPKSVSRDVQSFETIQVSGGGEFQHNDGAFWGHSFAMLVSILKSSIDRIWLSRNG